MKKAKSMYLALIAILLSPMAANADPITFDLTYSGSLFGNSATATGTIMFDDLVLPVPGTLVNVSAATLGVIDFSITVSGADAGNGTFGLADVDNWIWIVGADLDLTQDLVGQVGPAGLIDFNWCGVDFIGCVPPAPGGVDAIEIQANAETGDRMILTSMVQVEVPEPGTLALLGIGLLGMGAARRRKKA